MAPRLARPAWRHLHRATGGGRAPRRRRRGDRGALRDARERALCAARAALSDGRADAGPAGIMSARLPAVFLGHGSPMNALQENDWTRAWAALGARLPRP